MFQVQCSMFQVPSYVTSFHDFCHDSAKRVSTMALAAPKVQCSKLKVQRSKMRKEEK